VAVQVPHAAAQAAGAGAHRIDFEITQVPKGGGTEWQRSERSTFVVPR